MEEIVTSRRIWSRYGNLTTLILGSAVAAVGAVIYNQYQNNNTEPPDVVQKEESIVDQQKIEPPPPEVIDEILRELGTITRDINGFICFDNYYDILKISYEYTFKHCEKRIEEIIKERRDVLKNREYQKYAELVNAI